MRKFTSVIKIFVIILIFSCNKKQEGFILKGEIDNYKEKYIYLSYGDILDSAIVTNGKFSFMGKVEKPVIGSFTTSGTSASNREFYIENSNIIVKCELTTRILDSGTKLDWIIINKCSGSETDSLYTEFTNFRDKKLSSIERNKKYYNKLENIFKNYPDNFLSGDILFEASLDSNLNKEELKKLYKLVHWENQNEFRHQKVRANIFPEEESTIGERIKDFYLPNQSGSEISTLQYRGSYLLIDFWASWCVPCRKEFPEILNIYNQYHDKNFNVLGVSIDDSEEKWLNAIKKDGLKWENVISKGGFKSEIAIAYKIFGIPTNYLVDTEGKVIAKDMKPEELKIFLKETLENK